MPQVYLGISRSRRHTPHRLCFAFRVQPAASLEGAVSQGMVA